MNAAQLQKIRLGLLCANIKLGKITKDAYSGPKDPNPENWRTISGVKVHLKNGRIDGGAGGKFEGEKWNGKIRHGSEKEKRIENRVNRMNVPIGVRQDIIKAIDDYRNDRDGYFEELQEGEYSPEQKEKIIKWMDEDTLEDYIEAATEKYSDELTDEERKELDDFISDIKEGLFDYRPKGGIMKSLFEGIKNLFSSKKESTPGVSKQIKRPKNEQPELYKFNIYDASSKTSAEKLAQVNPNYSTKESKWTKNCQRCVLAYELVQRGYDVTVKPWDKNDPMDSSALFGWDFDRNNYKNDKGFVPVSVKSSFKKSIDDAFSQWGDGARAIVRVQWIKRYGGSGHVISARREGGKIVYEDPQMGRTVDIEKVLQICSPKRGSMWILRVDNRKVSKAGADFGVENRRGSV